MYPLLTPVSHGLYSEEHSRKALCHLCAVSIVQSDEQISKEIMETRFVGLLYCRTNSNIVACFGVITAVTMCSRNGFTISSSSFVCCPTSDLGIQLNPGQTIATFQRNISQHCWPSICKPWPNDRNI